MNYNRNIESKMTDDKIKSVRLTGVESGNKKKRETSTRHLSDRCMRNGKIPIELRMKA